MIIMAIFFVMIYSFFDSITLIFSYCSCFHFGCSLYWVSSVLVVLGVFDVFGLVGIVARGDAGHVA